MSKADSRARADSSRMSGPFFGDAVPGFLHEETAARHIGDTVGHKDDQTIDVHDAQFAVVERLQTDRTRFSLNASR